MKKGRDKARCYKKIEGELETYIGKKRVQVAEITDKPIFNQHKLLDCLKEDEDHS